MPHHVEFRDAKMVCRSVEVLELGTAAEAAAHVRCLFPGAEIRTVTPPDPEPAEKAEPATAPPSQEEPEHTEHE